MILVWSRKQSQRVRAHGGAVRRRTSLWTTDFSRNLGTYIVYNSHVTCSNSSFSLTMVMPTSHFFVFHWVCCLLPIGFLPKPGSVGVRICHNHQIRPRPQFRWFSDIFDRMHLFSTSTVGMVTFRQSPCWYHPWADVVLSTSSDPQHLWTWGHFGDHTGLINLSVNNIRRIHTRRTRWYIKQLYFPISKQKTPLDAKIDQTYILIKGISGIFLYFFLSNDF